MTFYAWNKETDEVIETDPTSWNRMMEDPNAKRIAETTVAQFWVSTVFLGLEHAGGMFETMAFLNVPRGTEGFMQELACERYETAQLAREGHEALVKRVMDGEFGPLEWPDDGKPVDDSPIPDELFDLPHSTTCDHCGKPNRTCKDPACAMVTCHDECPRCGGEVE